jgi:hypothetical protein
VALLVNVKWVPRSKKSHPCIQVYKMMPMQFIRISNNNKVVITIVDRAALFNF